MLPTHPFMVSVRQETEFSCILGLTQCIGEIFPLHYTNTSVFPWFSGTLCKDVKCIAIYLALHVPNAAVRGLVSQNFTL